MTPSPDEEADEPEPGFLLAAGLGFYGLLAGAALAWLWLRDRLDALPECAVGEHGPWLGSAVGLGVGWLGARALAWASPGVPRLRAFEATARRTFARSSDAAVILFVSVAAIAEELLFRLAVQDAFGLPGAVAAATAVNMGIASWRWLPIAALHALALSLLVQHGFGLLGSTTASAVTGYLNLRRIQCS